MTYRIYFIEKTRAQLCASVHTTTDDNVRALLVTYGLGQGYEVRVEAEG